VAGCTERGLQIYEYVMLGLFKHPWWPTSPTRSLEHSRIVSSPNSSDAVPEMNRPVLNRP
jgi:hypothetical protein